MANASGNSTEKRSKASYERPQTAALPLDLLGVTQERTGKDLNGLMRAINNVIDRILQGYQSDLTHRILPSTSLAIRRSGRSRPKYRSRGLTNLRQNIVFDVRETVMFGCKEVPTPWLGTTPFQ
jgi:hypothetical protein